MKTAAHDHVLPHRFPARIPVRRRVAQACDRRLSEKGRFCILLRIGLRPALRVTPVTFNSTLMIQMCYSVRQSRCDRVMLLLAPRSRRSTMKEILTATITLIG